MSETQDFTRDSWEELHAQARYLPRYPQDDVVRWALGGFTEQQRQESKALDLGCGGGRHAVFLAREGFQTKATDRSPAGVAETIRRAREEGLAIEGTTSELVDLPYENETFDAVLCYGVICYLDRPELEKTISEIHRILKPGGRTFLMTRSDQDFRAQYATRIESTTYLIKGSSADDYPAKGENGMLHSFLSESDVRTLFGDFAELELDRNTVSTGGGAYTNNDWLIYAVR